MAPINLFKFIREIKEVSFIVIGIWDSGDVRYMMYGELQTYMNPIVFVGGDW